MARRKIEEINAGSMADIAFLLLIFFLVTTTMEIDSGIGKTLPLKVDNLPPPPPIPERNVLDIRINLNDQLMAEGNEILVDELDEVMYEFYLDNADGQDNNHNMPLHNLVTRSDCQAKILEYQDALNSDGENRFLSAELSKWKTKLKLCNSLGGQYNEMAKSSIIRFEYHSQTSYGRYIEIQNIMKTVVNELRVRKCEELGWPDYFELNEQLPDHQEKIKMLRIMIPERIIEVKA